MVFLVSGGTIVGDLFYSWQQAGFFDYLFPLLLIFALVFGILGRLKLFEDNKVLNGLIALVIGLISIQSSTVTDFFNVILPNLGIGLIIFLTILLIAGLVLPAKWDVALLAVAAVIIVLVLVNTSGALGWSSGYWWSENWTNVLGLIIIIGLVLGVIFANSGNNDKVAGTSILGQLLGKKL